MFAKIFVPGLKDKLPICRKTVEQMSSVNSLLKVLFVLKILFLNKLHLDDWRPEIRVVTECLDGATFFVTRKVMKRWECLPLHPARFT